MIRWLATLLPLALVALACAGDDYDDPRVYMAGPSGILTFTSTLNDNEDVYLADFNADGSLGDWSNISQNEGPDREPAFSNAGTRIAWSSQTESGLNIVVQDLENGERTQLTDSAAIDGSPRWSPNDRSIAFYTFRDQQENLLWIMDADGAAQAPILGSRNPQSDCVGGFPGDWLDDERIIFRGSNGVIDALQICVVRFDGSDVSVVSSEEGVLDYYPALSPDGERVAFTRINADDNAEIYIMDLNGGNVGRLTNNSAIDEYPAWSPDGEWLAFHSDRDGSFDIYIMRPNGEDLRQVTFDEGDEMTPDWSSIP